MKKYGMMCSCGDLMTVEADNREEAVSKMKAMMTQDAIDGHMAEKHPEKPAWTLEQVHMAIEKNVKEV